MLSESDKLILAKLKTEYPEAYEMFLRREKQYQDTVKAGCHDIRNIVTLLSGSYQLLSLTNPQLSLNSRFSQMGEDIKGLVKAFNDIAAYRYAASIRPAAATVEQLCEILWEYIDDTYNDNQQIISITVDSDLHDINIDLTRVSIAIRCLIDNAVEAATPAGDTSPVNIIIKMQMADKSSFLSVDITNQGGCPDQEIIPYMYQPFYTNKTGHLGLGLAIVNESACACGGSIDWICENGLCRFRLLVPC